VDETLHLGRPRHRQHVLGRAAVEGLEGDAAAPVLADDAHQVHHGRAALHGGGEGVGLQHVAGDALDGLEAPEIALRAVANEGADQKALAEKGPHDVLPDEARPARDEDALHRSEA
jgi:hypothetical protein